MSELDRVTNERILRALDSDGLVSGAVFDDIEQEAVLIGDYWIGLDPRIPWQLTQGIRNQFSDLSPVRLRLDLARIEPRDGHMTPLRKAHWWGAKLDWSKVLTSKQGREARYGDPDRLLPRLPRPPQATFWWNFPRDQKHGEFQIEEFDAELGQSLVTRYLHALLDPKTERFFHVDGALKTHTEHTYREAYDLGVSKSATYEKLFRVDHPMDSEAWMTLVATFFTGSRLVKEYFLGE